MAAVIEFPDGTRARYEAAVWTCESPQLAQILGLVTEALPVSYRPQPEANTAAEVAQELGAVLVSADLEPDDAPADAVF